MTNFPGKTVDECKVYTFDFGPELSASAVLSLPIVDKFLHTGDDTNAAGLTVQSPSADGRFVMALILDGIEGCTYKLRAKVEDDNGQTHVIWALAPVRESAGQAA